MAYWNVPKIWTGEPAFILGGGPSLTGFDVSQLRGRGRVFAVNNAGIEPGKATSWGNA